MRLLNYISLLLFFLSCSAKKGNLPANEKHITANNLLTIIEDGGLADFNILSNKLGYKISSYPGTKDGSLIYSAEDTVEYGNSLKVTVVDKFDVDYLHLTILSRSHSQKLRQEFVRSGFYLIGRDSITQEFNNRDESMKMLLMHSSRYESYDIILMKK